MAGTATAQALNLAVDTRFESGLRLAPGADGEGVTRRSPVAAALDVGFIFDRDFTSEWGLGTTFQLEDQLAVAVAPQVRLVRGDTPWNFLIGAGVPLYVTPALLLGAALDLGCIYRFGDQWGVMGLFSTEYYFLGEALPDDGSLLVFNLGAGVRVLL